MAQRDITVLKDVALITCVVQRGAAEPIISAAREAGAQGATVNYGKGNTRATRSIGSCCRSRKGSNTDLGFL